MNEMTKQWLVYINNDLITAKELLGNDLLTGIVSFHCQQAIEKLFKAVLQEQKQDIPRIHSLIKLYSLVKQFIQIDISLDILKLLDSLYITSRYPVEFGLLPDGKPSVEEAKEFYNFALSIYEQVKKILEQNSNIKP